MLRTSRVRRLSVAMALVLLLTIPSRAGKPVKDPPPPPPPKPAVSYGVAYLPVAGLGDVADVNDHGECAVRIRVEYAPVAINTSWVNAAAVIDAAGSVKYLDNLIPAGEPWDLASALDINNRGQIIGTGLKSGVHVARAYLLTPNADGTGYDLTDLGIDGATGDSRAICLTESGDVLFLRDSMPFVRLNDGTEIPLNGSGRTYSGLTSQGMLVGRYESSFDMFKADLNGNEFPLQVDTPDAYGINFFGFAENGYSVGIEDLPQVKIRGSLTNLDPYVLHDPVGNVMRLEFPDWFPLNLAIYMNEQFIGGQPLLIFGNQNIDWLRFPGFDPVRLTDLMDATQQQALEAIVANTTPSYSFFTKMTTPRNGDGSVNQIGAPTLYGTAYHLDRDSDGYDGWQGIYMVYPLAP